MIYFCLLPIDFFFARSSHSDSSASSGGFAYRQSSRKPLFYEPPSSPSPTAKPIPTLNIGVRDYLDYEEDQIAGITTLTSKELLNVGVVTSLMDVHKLNLGRIVRDVNWEGPMVLVGCEAVIEMERDGGGRTVADQQIIWRCVGRDSAGLVIVRFLAAPTSFHDHIPTALNQTIPDDMRMRYTAFYPPYGENDPEALPPPADLIPIPFEAHGFVFEGVNHSDDKSPPVIPMRRGERLPNYPRGFLHHWFSALGNYLAACC